MLVCICLRAYVYVCVFVRGLRVVWYGTVRPISYRLPATCYLLSPIPQPLRTFSEATLPPTTDNRQPTTDYPLPTTLPTATATLSIPRQKKATQQKLHKKLPSSPPPLPTQTHKKK